jgi:hypothetical protein
MVPMDEKMVPILVDSHHPQPRKIVGLLLLMMTLIRLLVVMMNGDG